MTLAEIQAFLDRAGGWREKRSPVACVTGAGSNILHCYDAAGDHLADIGWRPFENGLFLC